MLTVPRNHANFQLHIRKWLKKMRGKKPLGKKRKGDNEKNHLYLGLGQMYIHKKRTVEKNHTIFYVRVLRFVYQVVKSPGKRGNFGRVSS